MTALPAGIDRIPLPMAMPVGQVNAYLLKGEVPALVDPGPATPEALAALQAALHRAGMRLKEIRRVIVTHPHADHFGLARTVAAESGARIVAHRRAVEVLAAPVASHWRTARFLRAWGERHGVPPEVLAHLTASYMQWAEGLGPLAAVDEVVEDGEWIRAGDALWRVLYTPGHSSGHICLFREADGTLISGDHLMPDTPASPLLEPAGGLSHERVRTGTDYVASLSRLVLLKIRTVLPGHGDCLSGSIRAFVMGRIAAFREEAEALYHRLQEAPRTLWELCRLRYPRVHPDRLIFAISNVAGHLDLLAGLGRVAAVAGGDGQVRWVALEPAALAGD